MFVRRADEGHDLSLAYEPVMPVCVIDCSLLSILLPTKACCFPTKTDISAELLLGFALYYYAVGFY